MNKISRIFALMLSLVMVLGIACACTFSASAETTAPTFNVKQVSQSGNKVTVAVDLTSGGFNSLDFQFNTSEGVTCDSINATGGVGNPANGKVGIASTNTVSTPGTVITATFTVPSEGEYSITGSSTDCSISTTDEDGTLKNESVTASVSGSASGSTKKTTTTKKSTTKASTTKTTKKATTTKKGTKTTTTKKNTTTTKKGTTTTTIKTTELDEDVTTEVDELIPEEDIEEDIVVDDIYTNDYSEVETEAQDAEEESDSFFSLDNPLLIPICIGAAVILIGGAVAAIVISKKKNADDYDDDYED